MASAPSWVSRLSIVKGRGTTPARGVARLRVSRPYYSTGFLRGLPRRRRSAPQK